MPLPSPPDRRASLLLAVAVLVPFLPALGFDFVLDDAALIVNNPRLRSLAGLRQLWSEDMFVSQGFVSAGGYYRPVLMSWFWMARQVLGEAPMGWHAVNIAMHVLATLLTFGVGRRLGLATVAAASGALVFGLHPLAIQSVAWVSGLPDPLATCCLLGALLLWLRVGRWRGLALLLLLLGMLSLDRALSWIAVPLLLVILRPQDAQRPPLDPPRMAWTAALLALPVIGALGLRASAGVSLGGSGGHLAAIWTAPVLLSAYLRNLLFPLTLSPAYPVGFVDALQPASLLLPALAIGLVVALVRGRRRVFFVASAALLLAPALDAALLVPDLLVADRYMYAPLAFVGLFVGDVVHQLLVAGRRRVAAALMGALLVSALGLHRGNLPVWQDTLTLSTRAHAVVPGHPTFTMNLSNELRRRGEPDTDCALIRSVVATIEGGTLGGDMVRAQYNLGNCLLESGALDGAVAAFRRSAEQSNGVFYYNARHNLVVALLQAERLDDAWTEAGLLIEEAPGWPEAWRLRAVTNVRLGRVEQAINCYRKLLEIAPDDADATRRLGQLALPSGAAPANGDGP